MRACSVVSPVVDDGSVGVKRRKNYSTFDQAQVPFTAKSFQELLDKIQRVQRETFLVHLNRLAEAELSRQFILRLFYDPLADVSALVHHLVVRGHILEKHEVPVLIKEQALHTE